MVMLIYFAISQKSPMQSSVHRWRYFHQYDTQNDTRYKKSMCEFIDGVELMYGKKKRLKQKSYKWFLE